MKKNIAVITGGDSSELVISLQSADQIINILDKEKYNAIKVILKGTDWEVCYNDKCNISLNKNDFSFIDNGEKITFDLALISIHGTPGEDGKLQAYLDMMNIPYTSGSVLSSSVTFNKFVSKKILERYGVNSAKSLLIKKDEQINIDSILAVTGLPCFVKPNEGGSSFGITKVKSGDQLVDAVNKALDESNEVIIEEFIAGRELTCGLFKTKEQDYIFPVTEIISKKEFFDFDAKYTPELVDEVTPADVSEAISSECQKLSSEIYEYLKCRGIIRIDYILREGKLYFLEVNTVPGMSKNSIVPKQARTYGLSMSDLWELIIEDSLRN